MNVYPLRVRIPDISFPHPNKRLASGDAMKAWEKARGSIVTVGTPRRVEEMTFHDLWREYGCDSEWAWPVDGNDVVRFRPNRPKIAHWVCCHEIEID